LKSIDINFRCDGRPGIQTFIPLGDFHIGADGCDKGHIKRYVEYIRKNDYWWWGMGDYLDSIIHTDPRFDPEGVDRDLSIADLKDLPRKQSAMFLELIEPIKDRCLFVLSGNHEEALAKHTANNVTEFIAHSLGVPYLGYSGFVTLRFHWQAKGNDGKKSNRSTSRTLFVHHGWGGGRKMGGKANKILDFLNGFDADDYFMGHVHDVLITKTSRLEARGRSIGKPKHFRDNITWQEMHYRSREHCFGLTGTFLKSALYSEIKGYNPSFMGAIQYTIDPFRWEGGHDTGNWQAKADIGTLTL